MRHVVDVGAQAVEEVQHQRPLDALESHLGLASKDALVAEEVHREGPDDSKKTSRRPHTHGRGVQEVGAEVGDDSREQVDHQKGVSAEHAFRLWSHLVDAVAVEEQVRE